MTRRPEQKGARQAGFGLVEVVLALTLSSVGLMAVAGSSMGIGAQASLARWDADQAMVARMVLEHATMGSYAAAVGGQRALRFRGRSIVAASTVTAPSARLKHIRLDVTASGPYAPVVFETRIGAPRPLPVAP